MSEVVIKVRENGPLLIACPVTLTDHLGNRYPTPETGNVALCRCGQSSKKPFCDGTHKTCGFTGGEPAPAPAPA